jgi:hypothetical protein
LAKTNVKGLADLSASMELVTTLRARAWLRTKTAKLVMA